MKILSDESVERINGYLNEVDSNLTDMEQDESYDKTPNWYSYHMGAWHAFKDVDMLLEDGEKKTAINAKPVVLVTVGLVAGVALMRKDEIKAKFNKAKGKVQETLLKRKIRKENS